MKIMLTLLVGAMITGCSPESVKNDYHTYKHRDYYQVKRTAELSKVESSDVEKIKKQAASLPFVSQAAVIQKNGGYEVALKLRTYDKKIHSKLCQKVKENIESQWEGSADVYSSPAKFREIRKQMKQKK